MAGGLSNDCRRRGVYDAGLPDRHGRSLKDFWVLWKLGRSMVLANCPLFCVYFLRVFVVAELLIATSFTTTLYYLSNNKALKEAHPRQGGF